MSDPRPPDDGLGWPEREQDEKGSEEPAAGWSDDPYRYEPPPRYVPPAWEPPVFEPPKEGDTPAWEPPVWEPPDADQPAADTQRAAERPEDEPPAWEPPVLEPPASETSPVDVPIGEQPADEPPAWETRAWEPRAAEEPPAAEEQPVDVPIGEQPADEPPPWEARAWEPAAVEETPAEIYRAEESTPDVGEGPPEAEPPAWEAPAWEPAAAEESPADVQRAEEPLAVEEPPLTAEEPHAFEESLATQEPPPPDLEPLKIAADEPSPADEEPLLAADASALADEEPLLAADASALVDEPQPDEPIYPVPLPEPQPPLVEAAEPTTAFEGSADAWDPKLHGNRRRSTTAEQAVPWLIGIILALAGMVIVLLALIFSSPGGLAAGQPTDTASPSAQASNQAVASSEPSSEASGSPQASPDPTLQPTYGALEMVFLGRPSSAAPIYLLRRDFAKGRDPEVLAQAEQGIEKFAWSPDGQVGAAVISGRAVALRPDRPKKQLADRISALTFGWDAETVYAVRIIRDGSRDQASILKIDFVSGATKRLAQIGYPHPLTAPEAPLREAQFIDEGGQVRIYAVGDGNLVVWILGAPDAYQVDPANGKVTKITRPPTLWSPDGRQRISPRESGNRTILRLRNRDGDVTSSVSVTGLVSHVRWAGGSNEIVFTLGTLSASGGVRQDLFVWDLRDGKDPMPLTSSGAAFGADWRGVMSNWAP